MSMRTRLSWAACGLAVVAGLFVVPSARAQGQGDGFLFRTPTTSLAVRAGFDRAFPNSDIYSFFTDSLTLSKSDFNAFAISADLSFSLRPQLDLVLGLGFTNSTSGSEYRNWWDQNDLPIQQTTRLERVPITASLKWYLVPPGRSIGRFAWVPREVAPFVGVGGGAMWYQLHQWGDFINFADTNLAVFPDDFRSAAWALTGHAFAGVDISLGPRLLLTTQARYTYARGALGRDFTGFSPIDLSGLTLSAGIAVRF
jgi:hypothetical protein